MFENIESHIVISESWREHFIWLSHGGGGGWVVGCWRLLQCNAISTSTHSFIWTAKTPNIECTQWNQTQNVNVFSHSLISSSSWCLCSNYDTRPRMCIVHNCSWKWTIPYLESLANNCGELKPMKRAKKKTTTTTKGIRTVTVAVVDCLIHRWICAISSASSMLGSLFSGSIV